MAVCSCVYVVPDQMPHLTHMVLKGHHARLQYNYLYNVFITVLWNSMIQPFTVDLFMLHLMYLHINNMLFNVSINNVHVFSIRYMGIFNDL